MDNEAMKFLHWYFKELSFDLGQSLIRVRTLAMNELKQKNAEINQLQKLLDQQQQLNLSNQRLLERQDAPKDIDTPPTAENGTQTPHEPHKAKKSLWRRLFK